MQQEKPITRSVVAHIGYGLLLLVFGLAASAVLDALSIKGMLPNALTTAAVVVPTSVLLSSRIGQLNLVGVAVTALVVALVSQTTAIAILNWMAGPASGQATWGGFIAAGFGAQFAIATAIVAAASVAWTLVIRHRTTPKAS